MADGAERITGHRVLVVEAGPTLTHGEMRDAPIRDLEATIAQVPCDRVIVGTPIDLSRLVKIDKPVVRARYELQEVGRPDLGDAMAPLLKRLTNAPRVPAAG